MATRRISRFSAGRDWSSWPVLLLLLTVLVPSAGVVWMMRAAMESERLAVRQRLADAYRVQLESAKRVVTEHWRRELEALEAIAGETPAAEAFADCVKRGGVDSVLILDADGVVAYPNSAMAPGPGGADEEVDTEWLRAERMEYVEVNLAGAAEAFERIAAEAVDEPRRVRAAQAQARCLLRLDRRDEAIGVLNGLRPHEVSDAHGRSLTAAAELRLLELLEPGSAEWIEVYQSLRVRICGYIGSRLPAEQRRFLMHRVEELTPEGPKFETLAAEDLAAEVLASNDEFTADGTLRPMDSGGVWRLASPGGSVVAIYRTDTIASQLDGLMSRQLMPSELTIESRRPGQSRDDEHEMLSASLAPALPGWHLAMETNGGELFDRAAADRRAFLMWIATILVGVTLAMTWLVARGVRRQMQVARLKNDLVATVSHELKTPLASIRLLVDTLLDGEGANAGVVSVAAVNGKGREYLQMIAQENARLTRLIDNFLTFSRMERGKHQFTFEPIDAREIIQQAVAAVSDRFDGVEGRLDVDTESQAGTDLRVRGDLDALVTAVVNLLDNAWKYGGDVKRVRVTARRAGDRVLIAVEDNGAGLAPRAARRVFERFYQVDQRLSRTHGGCGLGLSIVRYIVEAHGGEATVESRPGEGCRFTITLPADGGVGYAGQDAGLVVEATSP